MLVGIVKLSRSDPICEIGVMLVASSSPGSVDDVGVEIGGLVIVKPSTAGAVLETTTILLLGVVRVNSLDGETKADEVMTNSLDGSGVDETSACSVGEVVANGASVVDGVAAGDGDDSISVVDSTVDVCTAGSVVVARISVDVGVSSCLR